LLLTYINSVWHPQYGLPRSNFAEIFSVRKLESLSYRMALFVWSYI